MWCRKPLICGRIERIQEFRFLNELSVWYSARLCAPGDASVGQQIARRSKWEASPLPDPLGLLCIIVYFPLVLLEPRGRACEATHRPVWPPTASFGRLPSSCQPVKVSWAGHQVEAQKIHESCKLRNGVCLPLSSAPRQERRQQAPPASACSWQSVCQWLTWWGLRKPSGSRAIAARSGRRGMATKMVCFLATHGAWP